MTIDKPNNDIILNTKYQINIFIGKKYIYNNILISYNNKKNKITYVLLLILYIIIIIIILLFLIL